MKKIGKKTMMVLLVAGLIAAALPMAVMGEVACAQATGEHLEKDGGYFQRENRCPGRRSFCCAISQGGPLAM